MPERFHMEPARASRGEYAIFDGLRGRGDQDDMDRYAIALVYDPEIAARIVRLLNADVARTEKQGAVAP